MLIIKNTNYLLLMQSQFVDLTKEIGDLKL